MDLIDAVMAGNTELVTKLLEEGADPNFGLDDANVTPLHFAAQMNAIEIVPLLINAGANVNAKTDPDNETPLDIALLHGHTRLAKLLLYYINHPVAKEH